MIIGTLDILGVKKYQKEEKINQEKLIEEYFNMKLEDKYKEFKKFNEKEIKICKTSARFKVQE